MEANSSVTIFKLKEHDSLKEKYPDYAAYFDSLAENGIVFSETEHESVPVYLGVTSDFRASFYIGAAWLCPKAESVKNGHKVLIVTPKMDNIDFTKMFLAALKNPHASEYFSKFYGIAFNQPLIESESLDNILSPLLLVHYVFVLENLVKRGLKKDYVFREENLSSKVRGKILVQKNIRVNTFHADRIFCRFQEYSIDTKENRLLKKALLFSSKMLKTLNFGNSDDKNCLEQKINKLAAHFEFVSDRIEPSEVQSVKANKCYKEYILAIKIAKMILRRYDYSIDKAGSKSESVPPFWIDMSRLYEVYVYSLLEKAYPNEIEFQVAGHCKSAVDFIKKDEKLIMDTKYKPQYNDSNKRILSDIREISGYARDWKILRHLKISVDDVEEVKCLIIYPEPIKLESDDESDSDCQSVSDFSEKSVLKNAVQIRGFRNFYKISVQMPII